MVRSHRHVGSVALLILVFGLGVSLVTEAYGQAERSAPVVAERYQPGPLASRAATVSRTVPDGLEELLGLSVLVAFLYGFRASGLARSSGRGTGAPRS